MKTVSSRRDFQEAMKGFDIEKDVDVLMSNDTEYIVIIPYASTKSIVKVHIYDLLEMLMED